MKRVKRVAKPRLSHDLQRAAVRPVEDVQFLRPAILELRVDRALQLIALSQYACCVVNAEKRTLCMTP